MTAASATWNKHRNAVLLDVFLLTALYLVPSLSHATALPVYMLEPMRVAVIVALLFSNRANAYFIAVTVPLASVLLTGHPEPLKAVLMCIEFSVLIAAYGLLAHRLRIPAFASLVAAILAGKVVYYAMKSVALGAGWLGGSLVTTPVRTQVALALLTAAVFGLIEYLRAKNLSAP